MPFKFTVKQNPLEIEFETDSLVEALGILQDNSTALSTIFAAAANLAGDSDGEESTVNGSADNSQGNGAPRGRGRPKLTEEEKAARAAAKAGTGNAQSSTPPVPPAPPVAAAPPPLPIPGAPLNTTETKPGIPAFLDRGTVAAPPAPVAPPPAPLAPPAPPPVNRLCDRVIENLKGRKNSASDGGAALVTWLAQAGVVVAGATFDEAMAVLQFQPDDKLQPVASALAVA